MPEGYKKYIPIRKEGDRYATVRFKSDTNAVESLKYDTFTFRFFDKNGDPAEIPEKYRERDFSFVFDLGTYERADCVGPVHIAGKVPGLITIGALYDTLKENYSSKLERRLNEEAYEWLGNLGMFEREKEFNIRKHLEGMGQWGHLAIAINKQVSNSVKTPTDNIMNKFCAIFGALEPMFYPGENDNGDRDMDMGEKLGAVIEGSLTPSELNNDKDFPLFGAFIGAAFDIRNLSIGLFGSYAQPFLDRFADTVRAYGLESVLITRLKGEKDGKREFAVDYNTVRSDSIGVLDSAELLVMALELKLSKNTRNNLLFRRLSGILCEHTIALNDMISLRKELLDGEVNNAIMISGAKDRTFQEAFNAAVQSVCKTSAELKDVRNLILKYYRDDIGLWEYSGVCERHMVFHFLWYSICNTRYGDISMNIEVE